MRHAESITRLFKTDHTIESDDDFLGPFDAKHYPSSVINRFFRDIERADDSLSCHRAIVGNCDEHLTDKAIQRIHSLVGTYQSCWLGPSSADNVEIFHCECILFRSGTRLDDDTTDLPVLISTMWNEFYAEWRIVGIRLFDKKHARILRTIYASPAAGIFRWYTV